MNVCCKTFYLCTREIISWKILIYVKNKWHLHKKLFQNLNLIYISMYILYVGSYWINTICCQYMYVHTLYRFISLYFRTIINFYVEDILAVAAPTCIVTVPFIHVWMIHTDTEMVFFIFKPGYLWPWLISNVVIVIDSCGVFANYVFFTYVLFLWRIVFQFDIKFIGIIMFRTKN